MKNAPLLAVLALVTSGCLYREREAVERVVVEPIEADLLHWDGDPRFWTAENGVLIGQTMIALKKTLVSLSALCLTGGISCIIDSHS